MGSIITFADGKRAFKKCAKGAGVGVALDVVQGKILGDDIIKKGRGLKVGGVGCVAGLAGL